MMSNYPYKTTSPNDYGGSGLGLLGETLPDTIKIEHVFTLKFNDKWERPLRKFVDKWFDLSKQYAESFHFIAAGIGSYFFFLGVSKVLQASNRSGNSDDSSSTNTKKSKSKIKTQKSKEIVASTTVGSESSSRNAKTTDAIITKQLQESSTIPKTTTVEAAPISDSGPRATA